MALIRKGGGSDDGGVQKRERGKQGRVNTSYQIQIGNALPLVPQPTTTTNSTDGRHRVLCKHLLRVPHVRTLPREALFPPSIVRFRELVPLPTPLPLTCAGQFPYITLYRWSRQAAVLESCGSLGSQQNKFSYLILVGCQNQHTKPYRILLCLPFSIVGLGELLHLLNVNHKKLTIQVLEPPVTIQS